MKTLAEIREAVVTGSCPSPLLADFAGLSAQYALVPEVTLALLDGMEADFSKVRMPDEATLLRYCYQAAGTVGIHMARILGSAHPEAIYHAVDLGIAMQLTNIARDVLEDAERDRLYLPRTLVGAVEPEHLPFLEAEERAKVQRAVLAVLELAEVYYASGMAGIVYLPRRAQLGIAVAARVYREIGRILKRRGGDYRAGRAYVATGRKLQLALTCALGRILRKRSAGHDGVRHDGRLHASLRGLPFCHCERNPIG